MLSWLSTLSCEDVTSTVSAVHIRTSTAALFPSSAMQSPTSHDVSSPEKTPLFQSSTQYKNWRFSAEQLRVTRTALNEAAIAAIRNTFESDSVCRRRRIVLIELSVTNPCVAWLIFRYPIPRCSRGAPPRQIVYHQDISAVWPLSLSRGS